MLLTVMKQLWESRGQSATPDSENVAKNREKEGKNKEKWEKRGKIGKKRQISGRFFHFAPPPPDRQGWLRYYVLNNDYLTYY